MRPIVAVLTTLVLAACGASGGVEAPPASDLSSVTSTVPTSATSPPTTEAIGLATGTSPFGDIVVDGEGFTLYMLVTDRQSAPTCVDKCTGVWAPHRAEALEILGAGIDSTMVGTVEREDGVLQTTYNGWPLYRYRDDGAPGEMNGHGLLDAFFALGPHGGTVGVTE